MYFKFCLKSQVHSELVKYNILRLSFWPIYRIDKILTIRGKLFTDRTDGRMGYLKHGIFDYN